MGEQVPRVEGIQRGFQQGFHRGDGDGWVFCARGHRHWGRFGAAGLLLNDGSRAVLQHRASWTHEGDTWGLPGGARDSHEDAVATALREAQEEAELTPDGVTPLGWWRDDHGGWSYTTVVAEPRRGSTPITPHAANAESTEVRWWDVDGVDQLPLHRGFAAAWPRLRHPPPRLALVVDAANVVGARPDGWWRDRLGAARRLRDQLGTVARDGIAAPDLPPELSPGGLDGLLPAIALIVEGAARPLATESAGPHWWAAGLAVHAARHDGDTAVVDLAREQVASGRQTIVVSADRGLRRRLGDGVHAVGPSWLLDQLATPPPD